MNEGRTADHDGFCFCAELVTRLASFANSLLSCTVQGPLPSFFAFPVTTEQKGMCKEYPRSSPKVRLVAPVI